ncbi:MAG: hypothetical protein R2853_06210 [Thermomicrobiales bacterium]
MAGGQPPIAVTTSSWGPGIATPTHMGTDYAGVSVLQAERENDALALMSTLTPGAAALAIIGSGQVRR